MKLDPNSAATKWFVWCCDHFSDFVTGNKKRNGAYYLEHGTTLCHIFWAAFWFPMILVVAASFLLFMTVAVHIGAGRDPMLQRGFGIAAYIFPEIMVALVALIVGTLVLAILGASKVGLLAYLKALKDRVCPVVTFQKIRGNCSNER